MVQICELTLKIKHLPSCLNDEEKEDFLKYFGAQQIKVLTSLSKQKSIVYGKFESKQVAKAVLHRIHQLQILDAILCVEYAEKKIADLLPAPLITQPTELKSQKHFINYVTRINALNSSVGFDQPPSVHLRYAYPKANRATINNISYALDTVPQFYFQVLHLMNRMNLPPPFSNAQVAPPPTKTYVPQKPVVQKSDSESEIESDDENNDNLKIVIPAKRTMAQSKPIKRPKFIKPNQMPSTGSGNSNRENIDEVFEKTDFKKIDKIDLKVTSDCLHTKQVENEESLNIARTQNHNEEEIHVQQSTIISKEELDANRLPLKDLYVLPVFKEYHPGTPNSRLYLKNLAKTVTITDLERIYKRYYVEKAEGEANMFEIKLMTEGRMKGQAFITLDSVEVGQKAVKETNGFILKDKPLVVVFAKTAVNKK